MHGIEGFFIWLSFGVSAHTKLQPLGLLAMLYNTFVYAYCLHSVEASIEGSKSIITHLLSQVRIGMDLTKVCILFVNVLPCDNFTFFGGLGSVFFCFFCLISDFCSFPAGCIANIYFGATVNVGDVCGLLCSCRSLRPVSIPPCVACLNASLCSVEWLR